MALPVDRNQREFNKFKEVGNEVAVVIAEKDTVPTDSLENNPSLSLTYDAYGNLITIDKVIGNATYRRTITYNSQNQITGVSQWSEV